MAKRSTTPEPSEPLEAQLWKAADKLRKNIDAAEYKHVVLGLVFLRYISEAFTTKFAELEAEQYAEPEDRDEYQADNIFFVPPAARWANIQSQAKQATIGKELDQAMEAIEGENPSLKNVLPKVYARQNLDTTVLGELIDLISNVSIADAQARSADVFGHVFEFFLGEFALAEGKKGGQFYTPKSVVELLVNMLAPYKGRVFDPCCGSGGMFVQSEEFVEGHHGRTENLSVYGQESNLTTWRLCKMNLAIRGIDSQHVRWNSEGSFLNNAHPDLRADYVIANPPFNVSDWSGEQLRKDGRWKQLGVPPPGNANFAWVQHFLYHLKPGGLAGFVLAKGALTSKSSGEGDIRAELVKQGLVECVVNLPGKLFLNTQIPASLWFVRKAGSASRREPALGVAERAKTRPANEVLFIDARERGELINRRTRELTVDDLALIADTYHLWQAGKVMQTEEKQPLEDWEALLTEARDSASDDEGIYVAKDFDLNYRDVPGFCASVPISLIEELDYVLTPGRYVGLAEEDDDFDYAERMAELKKEFEAQVVEGRKLDEVILKNLEELMR